MDQLIGLLVAVLIFAIVAYGLWWVCQKFAMPQPVLWICGGILLVFLLYYIAGQVGAGGHVNLFPQR